MKHVLKSATMLGLATTALGVVKSAAKWNWLPDEHVEGLANIGLQAAGLGLAYYGRKRKGDLWTISKGPKEATLPLPFKDKEGGNVRTILLLVVLAAMAFMLAGCQGLAQALGANPAATAPTLSNKITVVANRGSGDLSDVDEKSSMEANGDVGASGNASASQDATQTISVDPEAVARGAAEVLKTATPGGAAATLADAALTESANGDAKAASRLLKKAKAAEAKEKASQAAPPSPPALQAPPVAPTGG